MKKSKQPERVIEFTDTRDLILYVIGSEIETVYRVKQYIKHRMPSSVAKLLAESAPNSDIDKLIDDGVSKLIMDGTIRKWGKKVGQP